MMRVSPLLPKSGHSQRRPGQWKLIVQPDEKNGYIEGASAESSENSSGV